MSIALQLANFDEMYHAANSEKFVINNMDIFDPDTKQILDDMIIRNYSMDNISLIPSCKCGTLKGSYYINKRPNEKPRICENCGTKVTSSTEAEITYLLWSETPREVEMFVSPIVLSILLNRYKITKPNVQLIRYIMIPNLKVDTRHQKKNISKLERLDYLLQINNIKRGYNSFVQNFFKIIEILESEFVKVKPEQSILFQEFLYQNRSRFFSRYLPYPNNVMFSMETNELGSYIDKSLLNPINVIRRLTGIDIRTAPAATKQAKVAKSLLDLADFNVSHLKTAYFSKTGLIRQEISSTRLHFTARGVITSIPGPHKSDELYLPWSISCTLFREHILNRLERRGYSYKKAVALLMEHNKVYHPVLDEIFKEIIAASRGGVSVMFNRNPSLHRGSIQHLKVAKIKTDVTDFTISMSYLIAPSFNADYDGDALNLTLILTKKARQHLCNFDPHHNILGLTGVNEFSDNIKFPKTIVSTLANWYNSN